MEAVKLLLVDDHDVVRTGLKTFLESQGRFQVVAEAADGMQAIERTSRQIPPSWSWISPCPAWMASRPRAS